MMEGPAVTMLPVDSTIRVIVEDVINGGGVREIVRGYSPSF